MNCYFQVSFKHRDRAPLNSPYITRKSTGITYVSTSLWIWRLQDTLSLGSLNQRRCIVTDHSFYGDYILFKSAPTSFPGSLRVVRWETLGTRLIWISSFLHGSPPGKQCRYIIVWLVTPNRLLPPVYNGDVNRMFLRVGSVGSRWQYVKSASRETKSVFTPQIWQRL